MRFFLNVLLMGLFFIVPIVSVSSAQTNDPIQAPVRQKDTQPDRTYTYDALTMPALSKLYWRIGAFDINDNEAIDNFMIINQCQIYKENFFNEFEWTKIRSNTRDVIKNEISSYPIRFKFVQPLKLKEYDFKSQKFEILDEYKIDTIKIFEIFANQEERSDCQRSAERSLLATYPDRLRVEFSQPFSLTSLPMDSGKAEEYIYNKMKAFNELDSKHQTKESLYLYRDAYIVMKIRMFSFSGVKRIDDFYTAQMFAILEGFEVYADPEHTDLLYFENNIRKEDGVSVGDSLKQKRKKMLEEREKSDEMISPEVPESKIPPKL